MRSNPTLPGEPPAGLPSLECGPREDWLGKPYYSLNAFLRKTCGEKLYKVALDAGFTCPNRDGSLGTGGCLFCSRGGSGDFARASLEDGLRLLGQKHTGNRFIAYFQSYTNTYGPLPRLEAVYRQALDEPSVAGISIATRPDCLPGEVLSLLSHLRDSYPDKFIWIELGLQTIHEDTALRIRRGYPLPCFTQAAEALRQRDIPVIVHIILGLPGEDVRRELETISFLNSLGIDGVKLQLLHVLKDTDLEKEWAAGAYVPLSMEDYVNRIVLCLERLSPEIVIHRLTGDGPRALLCSPLWSLDKKRVLNTIHRTMKKRQTWQGRLYPNSIS